MPKLTITSTFASSIVIGDPEVLTINLPPKGTKSAEVTDVQLRQLLPGLDKLKTAGWLNYAVNDAVAIAPVKVVEPVKVADRPVPPPEPVKVPEPQPVIPEPVPEPAPAEAAVDAVVAEGSDVPTEPAPVAAKPMTYDRKNRNR